MIIGIGIGIGYEDNDEWRTTLLAKLIYLYSDFDSDTNDHTQCMQYMRIT